MSRATTADQFCNLSACDICPFTTDKEGDLTAHKLNHVKRPGSIFRCSYCPFYVPSRIGVLEHMEIHGVHDGNDLTSLKIDPGECNFDSSTQNPKSTGDLSKRYRCSQCPYVSNSRTQFLYHKQFHRPRNAPFKCMYCSYNVSRRHLLHQHLRVHHNQQEITDDGEKTTEKPAESLPTTPEATKNTQNIPYVWVLKSGNFLKMFKCRWCPHVNSRKANIQDHEKMHEENESKKSAVESSPSSERFRCPKCSYSSNVPGVLGYHMRVHQGAYGEICCLVDSSRTDAEQLQELENSLRVAEVDIAATRGDETDKADEPDTIQNTGINTQDESLMSQPENSYSHKTNLETSDENKKVLNFCTKCPARFFFKKEIKIHSKFHMIHLPFQCQYCTYTARQRPHLLAHYKVHSQEYQEKTAGFVKTYPISPDCPQPKVSILSKKSSVLKGPVWMVEETPLLEKTTKVKGRTTKLKAKHPCDQCPAKFFKPLALQYHLTLHGSSHQNKCKYCDYAVKNYGNLIRHQAVHKKEKEAKRSNSSFVNGKEKLGLSDKTKKLVYIRNKFRGNVDPKFKDAMLGSPNFNYPTYLKNGKLRQKRFKCVKCPTAFEKWEQHQKHLTLHGSRQKHICEKCDYSVMNYANYVRHRKRHEIYEDAIEDRKNGVAVVQKSREFQQKDYSKRNFDLTLLEHQTLLLQKRKKSYEGREEEKRANFNCLYCPYVSYRKDAVDSHAKRHFRVSGTKSDYQCSHCDYSAMQGNFLRSHIKLHFNGACRYSPEAFLKCDKMELWYLDEDAKDGESKMLLFQDKGKNVEDRFVPSPNFDSDQEENDLQIFVNPETGESVGLVTKESQEEDFRGDHMQDFQNIDLMEMVEEQTEEEPLVKPVKKIKLKIKPKIKWKNWKCKKCPSAFTKKEQYLRHAALHGSKQRHQCDICDYSVRYYAHYVQHMRMHQTHGQDKVVLVGENDQTLNESSLDARNDSDSEIAYLDVKSELMDLDPEPESEYSNVGSEVPENSTEVGLNGETSNGPAILDDELDTSFDPERDILF